MKYMGSKRRIAKYIAPIMRAAHTGKSVYVEPFVGGLNSAKCFADFDCLILNDNNPYLIALYEKLRDGWLPPKHISEHFYNELKNNQKNHDMALVAYVGFSLSFGGKWFGGYLRNKRGDNSLENEIAQNKAAYNAIVSDVHSDVLKNAILTSGSYDRFFIPKNSLVYCDPPYANTTKYNSGFDTEKFWNWVRFVSKENTVFVSEYNAPDDFACVWSMPIANTLDIKGSKQSVEKLFKYKG